MRENKPAALSAFNCFDWQEVPSAGASPCSHVPGMGGLGAVLVCQVSEIVQRRQGPVALLQDGAAKKFLFTPWQQFIVMKSDFFATAG